MHKISLFLLLICSSLLLNTFVYARLNNQSQLKHSLVTIGNLNSDDINIVLKSGISLDNARSEADGIHVILNQLDINTLARLGYAYSIEIDDLQDYYEKNIRLANEQLPALQKNMKKIYGIKGFEFGSMGGYYTYNQVAAELDSMRLLYPELISQKQSIGTSIEGRDIWMVKISDNPDFKEDEPEIFYNALVHAREAQSMASLMYYMYYLLENYNTNPLVTYLVENREMYFVPVINPDGYVYNEQTNPNGGGFWRKNKRDNNSNDNFDEASDGVDLNRNFGYEWGHDDIGSSPLMSSNNYRGAGSFSEPETQAIRDFCISHNFQMATNMHSAWEVIFYPYGYDLTVLPPEPDLSIFINQGLQMTSYNHYVLQNPAGNYPSNGDAGDWMYAEQETKNKIYAYVYEVGPFNAGNINYFWPGQDFIYPIAHKDLYPNLIIGLGEGVIFPDSLLIVENSHLNANFFSPAVDDIVISADISIPDSVIEIPEVAVIVENLDKTFQQHVALSPILPQKQAASSSRSYTGMVTAPQTDDFYSVSLTARLDAPDLFKMHYLDNFTTSGPVQMAPVPVFDFLYDSTNNRQFFGIIIQNQSQTKDLEDITVKISTMDYRVENMVQAKRTYPDLFAGETDTSSKFSYYAFQYAEGYNPDSTINNPIQFDVDIYSKNILYWRDTFNYEKQIIVKVENDTELPSEVSLAQNYPNPFNPKTMINYQLAMNSKVELSIYNLLGQKVTTLVNEKQTTGRYKVEWDASGFASGVYIYTLETDTGFKQSRKLLLIK